MWWCLASCCCRDLEISLREVDDDDGGESPLMVIIMSVFVHKFHGSGSNFDKSGWQSSSKYRNLGKMGKSIFGDTKLCVCVFATKCTKVHRQFIYYK